MNILIIGGTLYFGKKLTLQLISNGHNVTLLNRGNQTDDFGDKVSRIICDRNDTQAMKDLLKSSYWDIVFDQVCYDYDRAKAACEIFEDKVGQYIFTSSQSVYETGADIVEDSFKPNLHQFKTKETVNSNYAEAKRQSEVAFEKHATFPTSYIRFPIVLGEEDYTGRFKFHVDRIKNGEEIYFKNLNARISFISADDAAKSLIHVAENKILGAINCCNNKSIKLETLVRLIEKGTLSKLIIAKEIKDDNFSPYGIESDWYMNSDKLKNSGLKLIDVEEMVQQVLKNYL